MQCHCLLLRPRVLACVALNLCQVRSTHLSLGISWSSAYQPTLPASILPRGAVCFVALAAKAKNVGAEIRRRLALHQSAGALPASATSNASSKRKPVLYRRTRVSGRMLVRTFRIEGDAGSRKLCPTARRPHSEP